MKIVELIIKFYVQNNFSDKYNIKIFNPQIFNIIHTEEEFIESKKLLNYIQSVKLTNYNCTDYNRFIIEILKKSNNIEEFHKNIGKNIRIAYMRKGITRKIKVSVIVPVYNVEPYLRKCLDSVCNQTLRDIEIICINDCSPDNCLEILKEYQRNDNRVKIIDFKENKGVAIARNEGIKIAKGEYIGFVDPDDWIDLDFYEKLYNKAKEFNSDLVIGNIKTISKEKILSNNTDFQIFKNKDVFYGLFPLGLYKNELLKKHDIKFEKDCTIGEDRLLPIKAKYYAKNFKIIESTYYYQLNRENSATKNITEKKIDDFIYTTKNIIKYINEFYQDKVKYNAILESFWGNTIYYLINSNCANIKLQDFVFYIKNNAKHNDFLNEFDYQILNSLKSKNLDETFIYIKKSKLKRAMNVIKKIHERKV